MTAVGQDTLKTRRSLEAAGQTVSYYSLEAAAGRIGDVSRLPYSMKVLLENLLRFEDGVTVTVDDIQALADWQKDRRSNREMRSEEHTSELQSLMRISYAIFCMNKNT